MKNIQKIDELKQKIDEKRPFSDSLQHAIQEKLRVEWTYNSNAIEGNTLTLGETAFYLREGLTSEGKPLEYYLEAKNHAEAIDYLYSAIQNSQPITESFIKSLHGLLLKGIADITVQGRHGQLIRKPMIVGAYKKEQNHVMTLSGKIHEYCDPIHVQDEMEQLIEWLLNTSRKLHPVERAAQFHYRFVAIHPFDHGNGRMSRLLMNLLLLQDGYLPCVIRNERHRQYLESLEAVDVTNNNRSFVEFVAEELLHTQQQIYSVVTGEDYILEEPKANLSVPKTREQRVEAVMNVLQQHSLPISISQILQELSDVKRATLKKDLQQLVAEKRIQKGGVGKGTVYSL